MRKGDDYCVYMDGRSETGMKCCRCSGYSVFLNIYNLYMNYGNIQIIHIMEILKLITYTRLSLAFIVSQV